MINAHSNETSVITTRQWFARLSFSKHVASNMLNVCANMLTVIINSIRCERLVRWNGKKSLNANDFSAECRDFPTVTYERFILLVWCKWYSIRNKYHIVAALLFDGMFKANVFGSRIVICFSLIRWNSTHKRIQHDFNGL